MLFLNTSATILTGALFASVYTLAMYRQKRLNEAGLLEFGSIFFSSSSMISGIKLIYTTCLLLNENTLESDKIYTVYGGFCVIYISISSLLKRVKP